MAGPHAPASAASARSATSGLGQGRRPHPGRRHPAGRGEAAPADEPRPDRPVARPELLPPQRPRPAARLGQRPGQAQRLRPDRGRPRAGPRRHPPAAVRPGDHREPRRQEDPSRPGRVPGGVREPLSPRSARRISRPAARRRGRPRWTPWAGSRGCSTATRRRSQTFGNFPSLFMGLVRPRRRLGALRRPAPLRGRDGQDRRRRHRPGALRASSSARRSSRTRT